MNYVKFADPKRTHETRQQNLFNIPRFRTNIRQDSISVRGPKLWESLPTKVQTSSSLYLFKKEM